MVPVRSLLMSLAALALSVVASLPASAHAAPANPFSAFFGEWTLKDDRFQQVWDGRTVETLSIPGHYTDCHPLNTTQTVLCVVTAGDLKGHIMWAYDAASGEVHHLSHFGSSRLGSGVGSLNAHNDLHLKLSFTDEPVGTYRLYDYVWISADEYQMMSRQYSADGQPTGNWYGGTFVRITSVD